MHSLSNRDNQLDLFVAREQQYRQDRSSALERLAADFDAALAGVMRTVSRPTPIVQGSKKAA
jgi:hypothetical protein